jgi:hypothetical protein
MALVRRLQAFRNEPLDGLAEQILSSIAEEHLSLAVYQTHASLAVRDNGGIRGHLQHRLVAARDALADATGSAFARYIWGMLYDGSDGLPGVVATRWVFHCRPHDRR